MRTRKEHLAWCKKRALEYCDSGDTVNALTSMCSDLDKHPETQGHKGIVLAMQFMVMGSLRDPADARRFIEGFN